ncbi:accessory factor UbiK family protein [Oxalobacter paraformigenes]|uniref:Ubiquinone biosynthesis accessory factor UbiK n=1 Tax=Oxalobacter paraformigenes TaxID=556268 RepID=C3X5M1_9BURK|nr:accessory factor UbiK family protein [Oxalobacter paraformigenes]EEO28507.1 hypothetical protein OFAG_01660 [Oxalobacter paraformigenes]
MNKKILDDLQAKLGQIMAHSPVKDIERNIRAILTQAVAKLDVVTKEEFEVQRLTLVQMQSKILSLETRLAELEHQIRHQKDVSSKSETGK